MSSGPSIPGIAVVAVLAVAVTGAGLVAFWPAGGTEAAGPPVGHNASEQFAALDGYTATVATVVRHPNGTDRTVQRIWAEPGTGKRRVVSLGDESDRLVVSNGSVTWVYDRAANNVTVFDVTGSATAATTQGAFIERLFARLNVSRDARNQTATAAVTPGSAPLPSVPSGPTGASTPTPGVGTADSVGVRYEGTATVAGRTTYVLTIDPKYSGEAAVLEDYHRTMYVDAEWFLPLKTHTEWTSDRGRYEITRTFRNVTLDPGLDEDLFTFDPPENATIVRPDLPDTATYDSAAALRSAVSLPVPDPDVPPSFEFEVARRISGSFRSASLQYANETATLSVTVTNTTAFNGTDGQTLAVDGREVTYRRLGPARTVTWQCNGYSYSVSATAVSKDLVLDVAASMECS